MTSTEQPEIPNVMRTNSSKSSNLIVRLMIVLGIIGVLFFAWFVWPSHYKYSEKWLGSFGEDVFTGEKQVCGVGGWQRIKISGDKATIFPGTTLSIGVRNGCSRTPWIVTVILT